MEKEDRHYDYEVLRANLESLKEHEDIFPHYESLVNGNIIRVSENDHKESFEREELSELDSLFREEDSYDVDTKESKRSR